MYCTKCGTQNPDEAKFCNECGQRLSVESAQSSTSPPEPRKKSSCSPTIVIVLILLIGVLCLFLYILGPGANRRRSEKPKKIDDLSADEQHAIKYVQNYKPFGDLSTIEGIQLWITMHKNRYDIEPLGWAAFESQGGWTVKWGFKLNGQEEHAEWWYNPESGVASPNNSWAEDMTP